MIRHKLAWWTAPSGGSLASKLVCYLYCCLLINSNLTALVDCQMSQSKQPTMTSSRTNKLPGATGVAQPMNQAPRVANNIKPLLEAALADKSSATTTTSSAAGPLIINNNTKNNKVTTTQSVVTNSRQQSKPVNNNEQADAPLLPNSLNRNDNNNQENHIVHLDFTSINDEILRKRTVNLVYFNANFNQCKHCYRFFEIWKDLAVDIRSWRQVVKLFTINCSDDDNIEVCRQAGVSQFPQVRYYWVLSNNLGQDGQRLRILGKSVHAMRHLIVDKLMESYLEHNKLLAQRTIQKSASQGPSPAGQNPLASLMPMLSQMGANPLMAPGGLAQMIGGLMGKSAASGGGGGGANLNQMIQSFGGMQGFNQMLQAFVGAASMRKSLSLQPLPASWPPLEQINLPDTQRLLDILPIDSSRNYGALLIMETQEFLYTGIEVMLDLLPYTNQTYLARVRDERSQLSKNLTNRDDIQAPALIYIDETKATRLIMTAPKYTNDEDLRRAFVRAFERKHIKYPVKRIWSSGTAAANQMASLTDSSENEDILNKINQVYMGDLTNAIRASLMEQVFRHPDLSDDQYNALVKYIYVLINYFPFNDDNTLKFFKRLHSWLQNQVSPMDIGEYKKQFHDIDDVLPKREWVACKSLANSKAIPSKSRKSGLLFENPAQLGKVVSNITKLFRAGQQKAGQFKTLLSMFTSLSPVKLGNQNQSSNQDLLQQQQQQPWAKSKSSKTSKSLSTSTTTTSTTTTVAPDSSFGNGNKSKGSKQSKDESPIERIIKSLTSGSLGSDSSILKLISTTLGGGASGDSASQGKSKFAREFPCGAWKLAHIMVVNEYVKDSPRKDVKHIVLQSLYQYMLQFYACSTCGNRISDVSGEFRLNLDDHLQDQGDSIMLLWKVHNRVNKRLESEIRPGSPPKQQFPSEQLCPKCRAPKAQNDLASSTPNWHDKQVLNFLVHHYRPQNIITNSDSSDSSSSAATASMSARLLNQHSRQPGQFHCLNLFVLTILAATWTSFLTISINYHQILIF